MTTASEPRLHVISLGSAAYSVPEVCRILQPSMTARKVHYWLDTGLLSDPVVRGRRGVPTLLSFRQLLEIRTVQRLRDDLGFALGDVREAIWYLLTNLFADDWTDATFARGVDGSVVVKWPGQTPLQIPTGQEVLDAVLPELTGHLAETRIAWEKQAYVIPGYPDVVSNPQVLAGAPTIAGTRIDTSLVAAFGEDGSYTEQTLDELRRCWPRMTRTAARQALEFEGLRAAA